MAVDSSRREADWILVRIGVEAPIFALQEHLSKVVVGRATGCELRCPGINTSLHQDRNLHFSGILGHFIDIFMANLPFAEILIG